MLLNKYPCEQNSKKKYMLFEVSEKSLNSTMLAWDIAFHVLTSFLRAVIKYYFVIDLFLLELILSIKFFFEIILHANYYPVLLSIAKYVSAKLPSPNFLFFT